MSEDFDDDRLAILRWLDPEETSGFDLPQSYEGSLRRAVARFARLSRSEQVGATITVPPQPGDWSVTVLDTSDIRRLTRGLSFAPLHDLFTALERRRRPVSG